MKIIELLKELPLINKKIEKKIRQIRLYSSDLDLGEDTSLPFDTVDDQEREVASIVQSVKDLVARRAELRKILAITNANTPVEINDLEMSITEWIDYREYGLKMLINTNKALTVENANQKLNTIKLNVEKGVKVIRFFDEKARNDELAKCEEILGLIDAKLEMVNAVTDVIEV